MSVEQFVEVVVDGDKILCAGMTFGPQAHELRSMMETTLNNVTTAERRRFNLSKIRKQDATLLASAFMTNQVELVERCMNRVQGGKTLLQKFQRV